MNRIQGKQLTAWGICAMSVPAVLFLPQVGWEAVLLVTVGTFLVVSFGKPMAQESMGKWESALGIPVYLWNVVMLSVIAGEISDLYGMDSPLPGILLLILAAYGFRKGAIPVVGAVLLFFIAGLYGILFLFSLQNIEMANLLPEKQEHLQNLAFGFFPILLLYVCPLQGRNYRPWAMVASGILSVVAAMVTEGVGARDFYTASKSVNLFGTMERLETLVACGGTLGAFCFMGMLFFVNKNLRGKRGEEKNNSEILWILIASGIGILMIPHIDRRIITIGTTLCWGLVPLLTQLVVSGKNIRKNSKNLKKTLDKWEDIC